MEKGLRQAAEYSSVSWKVFGMTRIKLDFSWKCGQCGMTSRKEPHRRLADHMHAEHGMVWCDKQNAFVPQLSKWKTEEKQAAE